jgi:tetratricopeptide (TPR) repeat protein
MQTQAVTYIVQRMTSMCTLFYLLSLWLYVLGRVCENRNRRLALWVGSAVSFSLAIGTKQIAATLPLAILLYEWFFFQDLHTEWFRRRIQYVLAAGAFFVVVGLLYLGIHPLDRIFAQYESRDFTPIERLLTQPRVVWLYIGLLVYPNPNRLNLLHDISISHNFLDPPSTLLAILGIVGLVGLAALIARRHRLLSFCILWFFLHLVIESSIIPLELVFEHRVYLPMFGVALALPYLFANVLANRPISWFVVCGLLVVTHAVGTFERNADWKDRISLWTDVLEKNPRADRAFNNRGNYYRSIDDFDRAIDDYDAVIELTPQEPLPYYNRANAYQALVKHDLAIADYNEALRFDPNHSGSFNNRGNSYLALGKPKLALADFNRAIELAPANASAYLSRANALRQLGQSDLALGDNNRAIELEPENSKAYNNRAILYAEAGKFDLSLADCDKAIELDSKDIATYRNRGQVLLRLGEIGRAIDNYTRIIELAPNDAIAYKTRGDLYALVGQYDKARADFTKALELQPRFADACNSMAWLLATCPDPNLRDGKAAVSYAERAGEIAGRDPYPYPDTLAAAYAETGNFEEAIRWQSIAVEQAPQQLREEFLQRLTSYQKNLPFHETPKPLPNTAP